MRELHLNSNRLNRIFREQPHTSLDVKKSRGKDKHFFSKGKILEKPHIFAIFIIIIIIIY